MAVRRIGDQLSPIGEPLQEEDKCEIILIFLFLLQSVWGQYDVSSGYYDLKFLGEEAIEASQD